MGERLVVEKKRSDGHVYRREFDLETDAVTLPPNWTFCTNHSEHEGTDATWLQLFRGRVVCYTDSGLLPFAHVHSIPDSAFDAVAQVRFFIDHYAALPDYILCSHFPFDHAPDFLAHVVSYINKPPAVFTNLNPWAPLSTADGQLVARVEKLGSGALQVTTRPEFGSRPNKAVWSTLFSSTIPSLHATSLGFMYIVPKEAVLHRTKAFWEAVYTALRLGGYEHIVEHVHRRKHATHQSLAFLPIYAFESIWPALFDETYKPWPQVSYR